MSKRQKISTMALIFLYLVLSFMPASVHAADLYSVLVRGDVEKAKRIISKDKNIDLPNKKSGWTPLMAACEKGYVDIIKLLLDKGAKIEARNSGGGTPFFIAVYHGHSDIARLLEERGANLHTASSDGTTPLMVAVDRGHIGLAKWLLERGAEADASSASMWTPLMFAAKLGDQDIVEALITKGSAVNSRNNQGGSPLFIAAYHGRLDTVKYLLHAGASVNSETNTSWTPLMAASSQGKLEVARVLIEAGADVSQQNSEGKNSLHLAALNGHDAIVSVLFESGAEIIPLSDNGPESYATALAYRICAEQRVRAEETSMARECFDRAATYFDAAAASFDTMAKQAHKVAFRKELKQVLGAALLSAGAQYQAQVQADQLAQISALRTAASGGGGLQAYYTALREYDKAQINLATGQIKAPASAMDVEELKALEELTSKLATSSREAAVECRRRAAELNHE